MGDHFHVDIEALKAAGLGLADVLADMNETKVSNIDCDSSFIGHEGLAAAYASFCDRWKTGIDNLTGPSMGTARIRRRKRWK